MKRDSFVFRRSFYEPVRNMSSNEDKGILLDAIYDYAMNGIQPENLPPMLQMAFGFISSNIDRDLDKYQAVIDRNKQNGMKGGRPKNPEEPKKPSGLSGLSEETQKNPILILILILILKMKKHMRIPSLRLRILNPFLT